MRPESGSRRVRGWLIAGFLGLTLGAGAGLWAARSPRTDVGTPHDVPARGPRAAETRRDRSPAASDTPAAPDLPRTTGAAGRPWRDLLLESLAGARVGTQGPAERELVAKLAADPAARTEVLAEIRALDVAGDASALACLLSAVGHVPDVRLQRQVLALRTDVSQPAGDMILLALALDRGRSTPDPSDVQVSTAVGTIGEIAEPELIDDLVALARSEYEGHAESDLPPSTTLLTTLCLSAHRSERANSLLLGLAERDGAIGSVARSTYLTRSRTADARALAVRILTAGNSGAGDVAAAISALARQGVTTAEFETLVAPALRSGPIPRRLAVVQQLPLLIRPATRDGAPLTQLVLGTLRELRGSDVLEVRSAAAVSMAGCVNRSGLGWLGAGVRGHDLLADPSISIDARKVVVLRWASALFLENADVGVREALLDDSLPVQIREALWVEVETAADTAAARATLRGLAVEALAREHDADVRRMLRSIVER